VNRAHLWILALALTLAGLGTFYYKWKVSGFPVETNALAEVWTVEARVAFEKPRSGPVKAILRLPDNPPGFSLQDEQFISRGFRPTIKGGDGDRRVTWAVRRTRGPQALYYRATIFRDEFQAGPDDVPEFPVPVELDEPYATALTELVDRVRAESADVATFVSAAMDIINSSTPPEPVQLFLSLPDVPDAKVRLARDVLEAARIPTEIVQALPLADERREAQLAPWLRVHNGQEWLYFNPETGLSGLPEDLFVWATGDAPIVDVEGANGAAVTFAVRRAFQNALEIAELRAQRENPRLFAFSLLDLPLTTQAVYAVLLMVPIGAFIIVILRNVIGLSTFGTFMPVLIAMAFRETQLLTGVILFSLIVALGLAIRFYLEQLRLLLVPRLAAVLTIVVMLMVAVSIVSHRMGIEIGLSVALFPMVIMAMTIERMSIVWEERGPAEALKEGLGTLIAAALIYLVMIQPPVRHFVLVFPELLLVLLALTLLMGRYTGYRLTELMRFKALAEPGA
jgi:hypothetical protein